MKEKEKPEFIFQCYKCQHHLYIDKPKILTLLRTDCPECGEEPEGNWIFEGEGDFEKKYGKM